MSQTDLEPGALMRAEIREQPAVLAGLLDALRDPSGEIWEVARRIRARPPRMVVFAARGTSDHAAIFAKYLVEIRLGLPAGLASPSTLTAYGARPDLSGVLLVAVSQSGGSPDLIETAERAQECGAQVLAVTNAPQSQLARVGLHVDVRAGQEHAVAATKSYTAELLALWLLVQAWLGEDVGRAGALPDAVAAHLDRAAEVAAVAERFRFSDRLVCTGRGYAYPTAREAALKLMETTYLAAHAFSGADLMHGPIAMVSQSHPVLAVVPDGVGAAAMSPVLAALRERGVDLTVFGGAGSRLDREPGYTLAPPGAGSLDEDLSPVADIVPLQLLALEMALARGVDPDRPRALRKVTQTW